MSRTSNGVGNSLTRYRMMLTSFVLIEGDEVFAVEWFGHDSIFTGRVGSLGLPPYLRHHICPMSISLLLPWYPT